MAVASHFLDTLSSEDYNCQGSTDATVAAHNVSHRPFRELSFFHFDKCEVMVDFSLRSSHTHCRYHKLPLVTADTGAQPGEHSALGWNETVSAEKLRQLHGDSRGIFMHINNNRSLYFISIFKSCFIFLIGRAVKMEGTDCVNYRPHVQPKLVFAQRVDFVT